MTMLSDLRPGQKATLKSFGNDPAIRFKLMSLGLLPGDQIRLVSSAPFGGPQVIGHGEDLTFAIRKEASKNIEVEVWTK